MSSLVPQQWLARIAALPADGGPSGVDWAARAPRLVQESLQRWDLTVVGAARTGWTAVVVPVTRDAIPLALKVVWPHWEALGEHLALRHWAGRGAVRLVAAEPSADALLLEWLDPDRSLASVDADTACEIIGSLLARLHVPAPPTIPPLADYVTRHLTTLARAGSRGASEGSVPRRIVTRVEGLARELLTELAASGDLRLLHTDLHFENVLARPGPGTDSARGGDTTPESARADAGDWLAIDPKPMAGHPGFEIQPVLRNRVDELGTGPAFRWGVRRRLELVCDAAGIDVESARLWSLVHTGLQIGWAAAQGDRAELSMQIALFKALED